MPQRNTEKTYVADLTVLNDTRDIIEKHQQNTKNQFLTKEELSTIFGNVGTLLEINRGFYGLIDVSAGVARGSTAHCDFVAAVRRASRTGMTTRRSATFLGSSRTSSRSTRTTATTTRRRSRYSRAPR